jgi:hypothetical protein
MIYFDMSACQYFDIPYYNAGDFHVSKDAYRRVMGAKLDQEHIDLLSSHRTTLALTRGLDDAPGWWRVESSYR